MLAHGRWMYSILTNWTFIQLCTCSFWLVPQKYLILPSNTIPVFACMQYRIRKEVCFAFLPGICRKSYTPRMFRATTINPMYWLLFAGVLDTIESNLSPSAPYLLLALFVLLLTIIVIVIGIIVTKYKKAKVRDVTRQYLKTYFGKRHEC